jgi:hypothetical protein
VPPIDNSYLVGLFQSASSGSGSTSASDLITQLTSGSQASTASASSSFGPAVKKTPTAPWRGAELSDTDLTKTALLGGKLIKDATTKLDVKGASEDYRKLFSLYQGLNSLEALAGSVGAKGVSSLQQDQIRRTFAKGLDEVIAYADSLKLDNLRLTRGSALTKSQTAVGTKRTDLIYQTAVVASGSADQPVASFQGDVRFDVSVKLVNSTKTVSFDLAEMGSTPRTLGNVVSYLNDKLAGQGLRTRFATERISGTAAPITVGNQTITLTDKVDQWRLNLKGDSGETLSFSAPETAEAVYVAQTAGTAEKKTVTSTGTKTTASTLNSQLLKFQSDATTGAAPEPVAKPAETNWVDGRAFQTVLGKEVGTVHATAAAADGSVYMIADVTDKTGGQAIKGTQDVALMKYDSAGNLVYTRTLGAEQTATGYALAVSADGKVAIAGSVTGALDAQNTGLNNDTADSFVTLLDAQGQDIWTQRRAARAADEASAVAFGDDGTVYVAGRAKSSMPGTSGALGGWDNYVQAFETVEGPKSYGLELGSLQTTQSYVGKAKFAVQFGTASDDRVAGLAVKGGALVVAGVENGEAVLRRFDLQATGAPVLSATRDLGAIQGSLAGIAIDGDKVVVAGTSSNANLSAGVTTHAHAGSGGSDAFAARLSLDLQPGADDRLAYYGGAGIDSATAVGVSNGKVWIAGSSNGALPGGLVVVGKGLTGTMAKDGFLARLDMDSGEAEWARRFTSTDGQVAPTSIAIDASGASALDRFGLPKGTLQTKDSKLVTAGTSLRVGDQFYIGTREGGAKTAVTIAANDTMTTLADKVRRAAGFEAKVEVVRNGDYDTLRITPLNDRSTIDILAGKSGKNALAALGLIEGVVSKGAGSLAAEGSERVYGLGLSTGLTLNDDTQAAATLKLVQSAISTIKNAYNFLSNPELFSTSATKPKSSNTSGTVPAYLTAQVANYQAALNRLTGG